MINFTSFLVDEMQVCSLSPSVVVCTQALSIDIYHCWLVAKQVATVYTGNRLQANLSLQILYICYLLFPTETTVI